jgi:hypothetical protein
MTVFLELKTIFFYLILNELITIFSKKEKPYFSMGL